MAARYYRDLCVCARFSVTDGRVQSVPGLASEGSAVSTRPLGCLDFFEGIGHVGTRDSNLATSDC